MRPFWVLMCLVVILGSVVPVHAQRARPGRRAQIAQTAPADRPEPDLKDVRYGPHARNVFDLWKAESVRPAPLLVFIHGGGFRGGDKNLLSPALLKGCLENGISVAAINYRLTQTAPFPAPMLDGARAIQFLRLNAKKWNLDPARIAASGGSAGAGMSLWLGFHDDLADPRSDDPVLRQSSRLTCMAVIGAQSTYDPRWISPNIGPAAAQHGLFLPFYGIKEDEVDTEKAHKLYEQASAITHATRDDPPVWMLYNEADQPLPPNARPGAGIHHPKFGRYLKEKMDALGVECVVRHTDDYSGAANPQARASKEMVEFLVKYLKAPPREKAKAAGT